MKQVLMNQVLFRHLKLYELSYMITNHRKKHISHKKKLKKTYRKLQCRVKFNNLMRITARHLLKVSNRGYHVNHIIKIGRLERSKCRLK